MNERVILPRNITLSSPHESEKEKIVQSALSILEHNILLTLATFDIKNNQPCSSTAYYTCDSTFNLYFWTEKNTLHSRNIQHNPKVAVNIFDSHQAWGTTLKGLQLFGTARVVNTKELLIGGAHYIKRFPGVVRFVKKVKDFHLPEFESQLYKIEICKIKIVDEETFGKEEWRELNIGRKGQRNI